MSTAKAVGIVVLGLAALAAGGYGAYKVIEMKKERDLLKSKLEGLEAIFKPLLPNGLPDSKLDTPTERADFAISNSIAINAARAGINIEDVQAVIAEHRPAYDLIVSKLVAGAGDVALDMNNMEERLDALATTEPAVVELLSALNELRPRSADVPAVAANDDDDQREVTARMVLSAA